MFLERLLVMRIADERLRGEKEERSLATALLFRIRRYGIALLALAGGILLLTVYTPFGQGPLFGGRLFVHVRSDPYALITPITRTIRNLSVDQPVERAATLEDVRAEVLTPDRLNALVFGGFAVVALAIAVVGVGGVLAFSVSARTREFGIRLAIGSQPRHLLGRVIAEGTILTAAGIGAGLAGGAALQRAARAWFESVSMPGAWVIAGAAGVLLAAAVVASAWPALRAARVDVIQALRAD